MDLTSSQVYLVKETFQMNLLQWTKLISQSCGKYLRDNGDMNCRIYTSVSRISKKFSNLSGHLPRAVYIPKQPPNKVSLSLDQI